MSDPLHFIIFRFCLITAEVAIFDLLFLFTMKKRKNWLWAILTTILSTFGIVVGLCFLCNSIFSSNNYDKYIVAGAFAVMQLLIIVLLGAGFYFAFKISIYELGSIISLAYATRWILFCLYSFILNIADPSLILLRINQQTPLNFVIYFLTMGLYMGLACFGIIKNKKKHRYYLELPAFIIAVVVIVLNTILISFAESMSENNLLEYSFVLISNIFTVVLIIVVNFYTQRQIKLRLENELVNSMLNRQAEQYKFTKANAELLHVKAHDLKHQVAILRKGGPEAEKILDELDSVVSEYESVILTDNNVINVILSEKWQYCVKHKIKMSCNVDPKALENMETVHLYTMLGNILDNAIEAVMKIKEKEKRIISLNISYNHGLSIVQCHNYFNGKIEMDNENFLTSKDDSTSHGYGIKSIKSIVNQYGGEFDFSIDQEIFNLIITIPN